MHQQHLKCFLSDTDHWLKTKQMTHRRTNMLFWMPVLSCFRWNDKTFFICVSREPHLTTTFLTPMSTVSEKFITFWHPSHLSNRSVTLEVCLTSFIGFFYPERYIQTSCLSGITCQSFRKEAIKMQSSEGRICAHYLAIIKTKLRELFGRSNFYFLTRQISS